MAARGETKATAQANQIKAQKEVALKSGRETNLSNEDLGDVLNSNEHYHLDNFITDGGGGNNNMQAAKLIVQKQQS